MAVFATPCEAVWSLETRTGARPASASVPPPAPASSGLRDPLTLSLSLRLSLSLSLSLSCLEQQKLAIEGRAGRDEKWQLSTKVLKTFLSFYKK